uniref:Cadherin domain-containing protein n=1 Tax=Knipowitschia caucasica TaxID=637954 RepID=A0AAV2L799_KNICA
MDLKAADVVGSWRGRGEPLDYERKRLFSLRVQVENTQSGPRVLGAGPFTDEALVKVVVEDVDEPPKFERSHYVLEVKEDAPRNTAIGSVSAADPDDKRSPVR